MPTEAEMMRTLEYAQKNKKKGKMFLQTLVSISYVLISIVVVFVVYVPFIRGINEVIAQREELEAESELLKKKFEAMDSYDRDKLRDELKTVDHYIPNDMKVAELGTFVNEKASYYELDISRLGISEQKSVVETNEDEKVKLIGSERAVDTVYLGKIEGPFSFQGTRTKIFEFLDFLVVGGYATTFNDVSVSLVEGDVWQVSFSTSYYYMNELKDVDPKTPQVTINSGAIAPLSIVSTEVITDEEIDLPAETPVPSETVIEESSTPAETVE